MNLFSLIVDKTTPFFGLSLSLIETHSLLLFTLLLIKAVCFSVNLKSQLFYATVLSFCFVNQHRIEHKHCQLTYAHNLALRFKSPKSKS